MIGTFSATCGDVALTPPALKGTSVHVAIAFGAILMAAARHGTVHLFFETVGPARNCAAGGKQDRRVRFKAARALIFINFSSVCLALRTRKPRFEACDDSNGVFLSEVR